MSASATSQTLLLTALLATLAGAGVAPQSLDAAVRQEPARAGHEAVAALDELDLLGGLLGGGLSLGRLGSQLAAVACVEAGQCASRLRGIGVPEAELAEHQRSAAATAELHGLVCEGSQEPCHAVGPVAAAAAEDAPGASSAVPVFA
mmetsp:Transcript_23500/g.61330  ORF Transcript_23500/g.61330 Transcript_23500/m.61330 type:complete len:147 (+) Transcript_23500:121-561(+)